MSVIGHGVEICTYATRPSNPALGTIIYQTDTDEYLKYATDEDNTNRWMQIELKPARNIIINGNMSVWQRGVSTNTGGGGASTYAQDRWCFGNNGGWVFNMSRSSNVPSSRFLYSGRLTATNAVTNGLNGWEQFVEQLNMVFARGKYVTLSFWIRGSKSFSGPCYVDTGTTVDQNPGNGNPFTGGITLVNQTVNITTSWQKVVVTSSAIVPTNANVLRVGLPKPSFVQNDWYEVTGVQLEIGTAPSEFEFEPYDTTLRKCQRYYYMVKNASGNNPALFRTNSPYLGNLYHCNFSLPVVPRITNGISSFIIASGTQIHKPGVRWDTANSIGFEAMPGGSVNYQMWVTPGVDDGSSYYVCYLYSVGIVYNGEL